MAERKVFAVKANKATSPTSKITHERLLIEARPLKALLGDDSLDLSFGGQLGGLRVKGVVRASPVWWC